MEYDLKIVGGLIVDGSGAPGYHGEVGVKAGKIVALGAAPGPAARVLDAHDLVVSPGFIDIHTHYDAQVIWDRMLTVSPWHGVTSVVIGNCGFSLAPTRPAHRDIVIRTLENVEGMTAAALTAGLGEEWPFETFPEYLQALAAHGLAINVGALIGHTALRTYVLGEEATERDATALEIATMRRLVCEAMEAGALGFATSKAITHVGYQGKPVPSRRASLDEILALAGGLVDADRGGIVQATIGPELAFDEFAAINRATGRPVSWTALLAGAALTGENAHEQLVRSEALQQQGLAIFPQVTPRPLNFEFQLKAPFIFEAMRMFRPVSEADHEGKKAIYRDPAFRAQLWERLEHKAPALFRSGFRGTTITDVPGHPELGERALFEYAAAVGKTPVAALLDLGLNTDLEARFRMPVANHEEDQVEPLLKSRATVLGLSDAGAHASQLCDACLSTYLLRRWVREKRVFALEEAVRMLTTRPAEVFGITDRGRLAVGMAADIVLFDPATVGDKPLRRVRDFPSGADRLVSDATGIDTVVVNGEVLRRDNRDVVDPEGPLPGRVLRNGRATH
ncbi:MAG: amidohydrolase family protein [Gammaproteobacteria bacterium]|uniref:N-acyl-D-amino-acid deacylase family protein n=1 Tax=Bradyrhizobium sp. TaxID=376 RepID=UPI003D0F494F